MKVRKYICYLCGKPLIKDSAFISDWRHEDHRDTLPCEDSWVKSHNISGDYNLAFLVKSKYYEARFKEEVIIQGIQKDIKEKDISRHVVVWKK